MGKEIFRGFKFGMILQIAIGPICIFIFQTACKYGFFMGEMGVLAAVLVDTIYILAAIWGVGILIEKNQNAKKYLKFFGAIVLIIFGVNNILGTFNISLIPSLNLDGNQSSNNIFLTTLILTLSSTLTIVFWAGVFSTKIVEEEMTKKEIYIFGAGAVLSTLFFLSFISLLGKITNSFISDTAIKGLNIIVGIVLIYFAIKLLIKKDNKENEELK